MKAIVRWQTSGSLVGLFTEQGLALLQPQVRRFGLRFGRGHDPHINLRGPTVAQRRYLFIKPVLGRKCANRADKLDPVEEAQRSGQQR